MITVKDLIEHLKTLPQDLGVIYKACSDYNELELKDITIVNAVDQDFYYMRSHPTMSQANKDKEKKYLLFPGN